VSEIDFYIRPAHWRQGYAYEAAQAALEYAYIKLVACGLFAGHNPRNDISRRLLSKLGFQFTRNEYYPSTGLNHPSYWQSYEDYARRRRVVWKVLAEAF
jgi:RimJ/RimL family protein N-acetyltransferase